MRIFPSIFVVIVLMSLAMPAAPARADSFGTPEDGFNADVYASPKSAVIALGSKIVTTLKSTKNFDPDSAKLTLIGDPCGEIEQSLREAFPKLALTIVESSNLKPSAKNEFVVRVALTEINRPGAVWESTDLESGALNATILGGAKPVSFAIKFVDKPWADDWTDFVNRDPKKKWVITETPFPCISESEAGEKARDAAAAALWPAVKEQMRLNALNKSKIYVTPEYAMREIRAALSRGVGVSDQFVQKFDRPYGRVWKTTLLIDGSTKTLDAMARSVSAVARSDRDEKVGTWASTGALVGVIILLYFFINAVTKGYFVWRLRAAALLVAIVGIITVMALR